MGLINGGRPHISIFAGKKGSGKTQLLVKLLRDKHGYRGVYDEVIIVSPTFHLQKVWNTIAKEGVTVYNEFSTEILEKIYSEKQNKTHIQTLIILDDNGDDLKRINQPIFQKMVSNSRHLNISMVVLLQKITQAPTHLRSNSDSYVVFSACSTREIDQLYAEIGILDKQRFQFLFRDAVQNQYSCFVGSMLDGKLRFYRNFEFEYKN
jgi:Cdc6-like AAA superfamily ATPase